MAILLVMLAQLYPWLYSILFLKWQRHILRKFLGIAYHPKHQFLARNFSRTFLNNNPAFRLEKYRTQTRANSYFFSFFNNLDQWCKHCYNKNLHMNGNKVFIESIILFSAFMFIKQRVNLERNIKTALRKSVHRLIYSACLFVGGMGAGGIIDHVTKIINKQIMNKICDQNSAYHLPQAVKECFAYLLEQRVACFYLREIAASLQSTALHWSQQ